MCSTSSKGSTSSSCSDRSVLGVSDMRVSAEMRRVGADIIDRLSGSLSQEELAEVLYISMARQYRSEDQLYSPELKSNDTVQLRLPCNN